MKEGEEKIFRETTDKFIAEKQAKKTSTVEKSEEIQKPIAFNRKEIESQIKKIALDGKEKGASTKIKELIHGYGVEKLSEVPDENMTELLQKVQAEV